jgi:uncharacterized protein with HEPN domain
MRDDRERLQDILKATDHILANTAAGRAAFVGDEMLQVWVLHHLQIIGGPRDSANEHDLPNLRRKVEQILSRGG